MRFFCSIFFFFVLSSAVQAQMSADEISERIKQQAEKDPLFGPDGTVRGLLVDYSETGKVEILWRHFESLPRRTLIAQQVAGTICKEAPCGPLTEARAGTLLSAFFAEQQRLRDEVVLTEESWVSRLNLIFAGLAVLISWLAYKLSRDADRRSIKNETEITNIKDVSGS